MLSKREAAINKFNKENHRYIYSVKAVRGTFVDLAIYGVIGERGYLGYTLHEAVRMYNTEAKTNKRR